MQQLFYWSFVVGCEQRLSARNYTNEENVVNHLVESSDTKITKELMDGTLILNTLAWPGVAMMSRQTRHRGELRHARHRVLPRIVFRDLGLKTLERSARQNTKSAFPRRPKRVPWASRIVVPERKKAALLSSKAASLLTSGEERRNSSQQLFQRG